MQMHMTSHNIWVTTETYFPLFNFTHSTHEHYLNSFEEDFEVKKQVQ